MERLLNFQKHLLETLCHRFHNGAKKPLLIPKAGVDGTSAGICLLSNRAKGSVLIALFQKFFFGAVKHRFIDAFDLLCHFLTILFNS